MFGYINVNGAQLSEENKKIYQSYYCGLCRKLKEFCGKKGQALLNYDMTFLALFLSALYEPQEQAKECRCIFHPMKEKTVIHNEYIDYAAAMTVALTYHKALDDWNDERKFVSLRYSKLLENSYQKVKKKYPRQCESIEKSLWQQNLVEKDSMASPDDAINYSGLMLKELFVYKEDFWSNCLRSFGYELGRFIYLMDAAMDYEKDFKKNNYNPLFKMNKKPEEIKDLLEMIIGNATLEFEKLPIVQDENLLRNILYGGVWQQYYEKLREKERKGGK